MKSRQLSFSCSEKVYQLIKSKSDENEVSVSQQVSDYLDLLIDEAYIDNVGHAIVTMNTTTIDIKLEEQTVALEVMAKNTKVSVLSALTAHLTTQTKLLTDLINDKITPIGLVLPDNFADSTLTSDDDFIDWDNDIYETAIRLLNKYILFLNQHNHTISLDDSERLVTLIGDATVELA